MALCNVQFICFLKLRQTLLHFITLDGRWASAIFLFNFFERLLILKETQAVQENYTNMLNTKNNQKNKKKE